MSDSHHTSGFEAPDPAILAPLFPGYDISGLIACGGMGAVYHAVQRSLDRAVAIKILPREFSADAAFCAGFEAEAKAMARLNHPNLIGVYDFGEVDGMLFIIMEFVAGQSLYHSANGIAVDPNEVNRLVSGICHGLAHAHQNGIIHRDIKPANILLDLNLQPKIGDFGLARPLDRQVEEGEEIFGTPHYTAPEVVNSPQSVDSRADIFSLGVLLHELLTGRLPADDPRPPSAISHCDPRFDAVVRRATHPSPEGRYTSAEEIAADLSKIASTAGPRVLQTAASGGRRPAVAPRAYKPVKQSSGSPVIILLLVAAIGGAAFFLMKKSQPAPVVTPEPTPTTEPVTAIAPPVVEPPPEPVIAPPPAVTAVDDEVDDEEEETDDSPETASIDGVQHWQNASSTWNPLPNGNIEFSVSSGDIWATADNAAFKHQPWTDDGVFTMKVGGLKSSAAWAKAGLMVRENLEADSRHAVLVRSAGKGTALQFRSSNGGASSEAIQNPNEWEYLRMTRSGDQLSAEISENGSAWTSVGSVTLTGLAADIHVGFVTSSVTPNTPLTGWVSPVDAIGVLKPTFDVSGFFERAQTVMRERAKQNVDDYNQKLLVNIKSFERDIKRLIRNVHVSRRDMYETSLKRVVEEWTEDQKISGNMPELLYRLRNSDVVLEEHKNKQEEIDAAFEETLQSMAPVYILGIEKQIERLVADNDPAAVKLLEQEIERTKTSKSHFRDIVVEED